MGDENRLVREENNNLKRADQKLHNESKIKDKVIRDLENENRLLRDENENLKTEVQKLHKLYRDRINELEADQEKLPIVQSVSKNPNRNSKGSNRFGKFFSDTL